MDKYVVRKPRDRKTEGPTKERGRTFTQATIESLQGVVVVEDIWRLKTNLKMEGQSTDALLDALHQLQKKIPSRDVLKTTKIGHTVNRLTKHEDRDVCQLAAEIVKHWKGHFESKLDKPLIEVKCDNKTEKLRKAGRKHLATSLGVPEKSIFPEMIEREAFHQHKRLVSNAYRRTMRTLVFTLKHQDNIRTQLLDKHMQVVDFVSQFKKDPKPS